MTAVIKVFTTDENNLLVQFYVILRMLLLINVMCLSVMVTVTEELNKLHSLHFEGEEVVMVKP